MQVIILIINEYSKKIAKNREILRMEGVPFLCFYLKKVNMEKQLKLNLGNIEFLNKFVQVEDEKYIKAQPRGIVCHWMAGNVLNAWNLFSTSEYIMQKLQYSSCV